MIDDVGSGVLADRVAGSSAGEPALRRSVAAGAALVCCSGDKLLGGPQAGLLVGPPDAWRPPARHPLARALRIDKLSLAALEATLMLLPRSRAAPAREIPCWRCSIAERRALRGARGRAGRAIGPEAERRPGRRQGRRRSAAAARARGAGGGAAPGEPDGSPDDCAQGRSAGDRPDPRGPGAARPADAQRRRGRSGGGAAVRAALGRMSRAADARHRRPHRPRQDGADPGPDRGRHRPPARGARARDLDRARLRRSSSFPPGGGCRSSTCPATSASCARWWPAPPGSTCT